ncbi:MAG: preprotein translocase subunit YajC [Proteobacteria bacterium]|jgi:preprotein translocase subunit YajC|nr:preprotein translocase subunit YajC [Pseudomonadota bacterium]
MQPQPSPWLQIVPFILVFGIFYFLIIRPQSKRMKTHEKFLNDLKRGDQVVTNGGILGTIDGMTDHVVTLEVSDGVKVKVMRRQIAASQASLTEKKS